MSVTTVGVLRTITVVARCGSAGLCGDHCSGDVACARRIAQANLVLAARTQFWGGGG